MKRAAAWMTVAVGAMLMSSLAVADAASEAMKQWGNWRGPLLSGVAPAADPPLVWSESKNVKWKRALSGLGQSSPVVWGERIFLTTAVPHGEVVEQHDGHDHDSHDQGAHDNMPATQRHRFVVIAIDRRSGEIVWQKTVTDQVPHESTHLSASWASHSAVTDGKRVYASFGSRGIFALDFDGKLQWKADVGRMRVKHGHGEGSSPALHGNRLVINWDHEGESFITALDTGTGEPSWTVARDEGTSWSTPLIVEHGDGVQVIVAATHRTRGYDLEDGRLIWECGGLSGNVVATPVHDSGVVYVANSYESRNMLAIRLAGAQGDITGSEHVLWHRKRDTPYVPSPLLDDGRLYFLKHYQGLLTAVNAADGKPLFGPSRLPGIRNVYASPVAADGRIYIVDTEGNTLVIESGKTFKVLAQNKLDEGVSATPALVGRTIYLRGERHLYAIEAAP